MIVRHVASPDPPYRGKKRERKLHVDPHSSVLLHPKCHSTRPNWSKAQQGLLAPPISLRPFP